jgi:hypothetical protein
MRALRAGASSTPLLAAAPGAIGATAGGIHRAAHPTLGFPPSRRSSRETTSLLTACRRRGAARAERLAAARSRGKPVVPTHRREVDGSSGAERRLLGI